jgi:hypothetical protein
MVYLLDASDLTEWDTNVRQKAIEVAQGKSIEIVDGMGQLTLIMI